MCRDSTNGIFAIIAEAALRALLLLLFRRIGEESHPNPPPYPPKQSFPTLRPSACCPATLLHPNPGSPLPTSLPANLRWRRLNRRFPFNLTITLYFPLTFSTPSFDFSGRIIRPSPIVFTYPLPCRLPPAHSVFRWPSCTQAPRSNPGTRPHRPAKLDFPRTIC